MVKEALHYRVPAWQVLRPSVVESRFRGDAHFTLSPLVGREEELDLLQRRWVQRQERRGSRCAGVWRGRPRQVADRGDTECSCRRAGYSSALFLLASSPGRCRAGVDQLGRAAGPAREDTPVKLEARSLGGTRRAARRGCCIPRRSAFLACFGECPLPDLSPQRKQRTPETLIESRAWHAMAGADGLRGRALDGLPDDAQAASRSHRRACAQPARCFWL